MFGARAPVHLVPGSGWDPPSPLICLSVSSCLTLSLPSAKAARAGRRSWARCGTCFGFLPATGRTAWPGLLGFPRQVKAALHFSGCNTRQRLPVCKLSRGKCSHICLPLLLPCCLSRNQKFQLEQSGDQPGDGDSSWRRTMKVQGRFLMVGPRSSFPLAGLLDGPHAA